MIFVLMLLLIAVEAHLADAFCIPRERGRWNTVAWDSTESDFSERKDADLKTIQTPLSEVPWNDDDPMPDTDSLLDPFQPDDDDLAASNYYCVLDWDDISAPYTTTSEDSECTFVEYYGPDGLAVPAGRLGKFKERLGTFLARPFWEVGIAISILSGTLLVALSTLENSSFANPQWILWCEQGIAMALFSDFVGRWISSPKDATRFVLSGSFLLDIVVIVLPLLFLSLPSIVSAEASASLASASTTAAWGPAIEWFPKLPTTWIRRWPELEQDILLNLQLLRCLRIRRVLNNLETFGKFERAILGLPVQAVVETWQLRLARVLLSLFTLVSVATGLIYTVEHKVNHTLDNYFEALYFGLTTLTTVGFGDITPVTAQGKVVVSGSILFGVAVLPTQLAALAEALLSRLGDVTKPTQLLPSSQSSWGIPLDNGRSETSNNPKSWTLRPEATCGRCGAQFHWDSARYCHSCGSPLSDTSPSKIGSD